MAQAIRFSLPMTIILAIAGCTLILARTAERPVALRGATLLTMTGKTIEDGTVVIQDGKIAGAGKGIDVPAGAEVIDARGMYVLPGLVDPHSQLGVYSLAALTANSDGNEMTGDIEAQVGPEDAINTDG